MAERANGVQNHLIIGLGGTGGRVLRAFRKTILQEFGAADPTIEGLKLSYLYVDSSEADLNNESGWTVLGQSVQLPLSSRMSVKGADLGSRLDNVTGYPGIQPWIGDRKQWSDILRGTVGDVVGGQKRRLGRFLFACRATDFVNSVREKVGAMQDAGYQGVTFHICCGLAGGTGSGTVIDAISLIRGNYEDQNLYRIRLYAYLPEEHPKTGWDTGNYQANGYAALTELNAMSTGAWIPHDVTGTVRRPNERGTDRGRYVPGRFLDPFAGCYIYTNVNSQGVQLDIEHELPGTVADFLYQKIVTTRTQDIPQFASVENVENKSDTYERHDDLLLRSKRFLAFGVKRLAVPEEEITEFLAFNFAQQGALQMCYNNWHAGGFRDTPQQTEFDTAVRQVENQNQWRLSDDHLTLSRGILDADAGNNTWKTLPEEWTSVNGPWKAAAQSAADGRWLDALEEKFYRDRFDKRFRQSGVQDFFATKMKAVPQMAKKIRQLVEEYLVREFRQGGKGIADIQAFLRALAASLPPKTQQFQVLAQKERESEVRHQQSVDANKGEWARMGMIAKAVGKDHKLLDQQQLALQSLFIAKTKAAGYELAEALSKEVAREIGSLKNEADDLFTKVTKTAKSFGDRAAGRCQGDDKMDFRGSIIRVFEPKKIRARWQDEYLASESLQKEGALAMREALVPETVITLAELNRRLNNEEELTQILVRQGVKNTKKAQAQLEKDPGDRLFGVGIVEKLRSLQLTPGTPEFNTFFVQVVAQSGLLVNFDGEEEQLVSLPSVPKAEQRYDLCMVIRPNEKQNEAFISAMDDAIRKCLPTSVQSVFVNSTNRDNEITIIRVSNYFPLRFVKRTKFLKDKYEQRVHGHDPARAILEIHTEGNEKFLSEQLPGLFVMSDEEARNRALRYILLGKAMGLVKADQGGDLQITTHNKVGLPFDVPLGRTLEEAFQKIDHTNCDLIQNEILRALKSPEFSGANKRDEIKNAIIAELKQMHASRNPNSRNSLFETFREKAEEAIELLNQ